MSINCFMQHNLFMLLKLRKAGNKNGILERSEKVLATLDFCGMRCFVPVILGNLDGV